MISYFVSLLTFLKHCQNLSADSSTIATYIHVLFYFRVFLTVLDGKGYRWCTNGAHIEPISRLCYGLRRVACGSQRSMGEVACWSGPAAFSCTSRTTGSPRAKKPSKDFKTPRVPSAAFDGARHCPNTQRGQGKLTSLAWRLTSYPTQLESRNNVGTASNWSLHIRWFFCPHVEHP